MKLLLCGAKEHLHRCGPPGWKRPQFRIVDGKLTYQAESDRIGTGAVWVEKPRGRSWTCCELDLEKPIGRQGYPCFASVFATERNDRRLFVSMLRSNSNSRFSNGVTGTGVVALSPPFSSMKTSYRGTPSAFAHLSSMGSIGTMCPIRPERHSSGKCRFAFRCRLVTFPCQGGVVGVACRH